jgi:hypothetical protein
MIFTGATLTVFQTGDAFCLFSEAVHMGEIGSPTPKEQPPRKLSGKRTIWTSGIWKEIASGTIQSAEGVMLSGKKTDEAPVE